MIKGTIRVHEVPTDRPMETKNIAQLIAHQLRKGSFNHDNNRTEVHNPAAGNRRTA